MKAIRIVLAIILEPTAQETLYDLCLEYVAFKQFAPDKSIGFDLSAEYRLAEELFGQ